MAYKNFKLTEFIEEIGAELRSVRTIKKLTINAVVNDLSSPTLQLSNTMLGRIETGERRIDDDLFIALCDYYSVDPYALIVRAAQNHISSIEASNSNPINEITPVETNQPGLSPTELYRLYDAINASGKAEVESLLRMMAYMKTFQK